MKNNSAVSHIVLLMMIGSFISTTAQTNRNMFHGAIKDKSGNLWFANIGSGVYRFDAATEKFTNYTMKDGLPSDHVGSVAQDRSGIFWITTESGICRYDGKEFTKFNTAPFDSCSLEYMYEDIKGNFWFSSQGYGIFRYNPQSNAFKNFSKQDGLSTNTVHCMLEDKSGNFWIGERAGGVSRYDPVSEKFTPVSGSCFSREIMGMVEDNSGYIWFANLYNGLCRYASASDTYTHFTESEGICNNNVTCLYKDSKGNLWFGSDKGKGNMIGEGGVCKYDGKVFTSFDEKEGITQSDVWTIVEDNTGRIWVGTKGGLYRFHPQSGRFVDYTFKVDINN